MKIEIVQHYRKDDPDCSDDYIDVELFIDGNLIRKYGDSYHDKGDIKAEVFAEGLKWAIANYNAPDDMAQIRKTYVADREAW